MKRRSQPKVKRQKAKPYWKKVQDGNMMYGPSSHSQIKGMQLDPKRRKMIEAAPLETLGAVGL